MDLPAGRRVGTRHRPRGESRRQTATPRSCRHRATSRLYRNPLTAYPGTQIFEQFRSEGRLLTEDWSKYNGSTVVFQPWRMSVEELRHAQMAAFNEFFQPGSALARLGILPFKRNSWLANLAIHRGLTYYYSRKGRPLPRFADRLACNATERVARSLGMRAGQ